MHDLRRLVSPESLRNRVVYLNTRNRSRKAGEAGAEEEEDGSRGGLGHALALAFAFVPQWPVGMGWKAGGSWGSVRLVVDAGDTRL